MAADGAGYFADNYFHANYWHPDYWAEAGAAAAEPEPGYVFTHIAFDRVETRIVTPRVLTDIRGID